MTSDLGSLRFVDEADVWKDDVLVGRLVRDHDGSVRFAYLDDYEGPPVASTLPVSSTPPTSSAPTIGTTSRAGAIRPGRANGGPSSGAGLPAFFAGLLPEGHRLTVLRRAVKTSPDDELSLLLAVGADTPGDVRVVPSGTSPTDPEPIAVADPADLDFGELMETVDRHALPGIQAKASASMMTTPVSMRNQRAILKLDPPEHPHLVVNEAAHLKAAAQLKIPVSNAEVVRDRDGRPGLLVQRFDRHLVDGVWNRVMMEDGAQALGVLPAAKYTVTAEELTVRLAGLTHAPLVAVRNLYLQFIFAWLSGNGDLHAKNAAVLAAATGSGTGSSTVAMSPVFDIPCTLLYGDETMALPVAGRTTRIRPRHWAEFAESIGLPQKAAASCNALALRAATSVRLSDLPFDGSRLNRAERELRIRRGEFDADGGPA